MRIVGWFFVITFTSTSSVWAQSPCQTADNLITNCGFDTGVGGWGPSRGFITHDLSDGADQLGALQIRASSGESLATQSVCVNSPPVAGRQYDFGASFRVVSDDRLNFCRVDVTEFSADNCTGSQTQHLASQGFPSMSDVFSDVSSEFESLPDSLSMRVRLDCDQNFGSHIVNWDDVFLRERVEPPPDGDFSTIMLDAAVTPLEIDMGQLGPVGSESDLLIIQLWNNAFDDNRLTAFRVPSPYDGNGVTSADIDAGSLFGLNLCVLDEDQAMVVYTKDFNTEIALFDGAGWTTNTLAQTQDDEYHYADCAITASGTVIQAFNSTLNRLDVFKRAPVPARAAEKGVFDEFTFAFSLGSEVIPGGPLSPFFGGIPATADTGMNVFDPATSTNIYSLLVKAESDGARRLGLVDADSGNVNLVTIDGGAKRGSSSDDDGSEDQDEDPDTNSPEKLGDSYGWLAKGQSPSVNNRRWLATKSGGTGMVYRINRDGNQQIVNLGPSRTGLVVRNRLVVSPDGKIYRFARRAFAIDRNSLVFQEIGAYPFTSGGGVGDLLLPFNTVALAGNASGLALTLLRLDLAFKSNFDE